MATDLKALNRRFYEEIIQEGNLDLIDDLVSDDIVEHVPLPGQGTGREGTKQAIRMFREAFPDIRADIQVEIAEGDLVAVVARFTGTHQGEFIGIPPTGKKVAVLALDVSRIRDGKFVEHWGLFDTAALMEQLGAAPQG